MFVLELQVIREYLNSFYGNVHIPGLRLKIHGAPPVAGVIRAAVLMFNRCGESVAKRVPRQTLKTHPAPYLVLGCLVRRKLNLHVQVIPI